MESFPLNLSEAEERRALDLHQRSVIIDGLFHSLLRDPVYPVDGKELFDQLLDGGVTVVHESIVMDGTDNDFKTAVKGMIDHDLIFELVPDKSIPILSIGDVHRAKRERKVGVVYQFQGAAAIEDDLDFLIAFQKMGLRVLQIMYNHRNRLGDGCYSPEDGGLTRFGQQAVDLCNQVGVVIDLTHAGHRTAMDATLRSRQPVIISHANPRALKDHIRNARDELIKAVASTGGLIGLCPHCILTEKDRGVRPTLSDYLDHVDYVVNLVGVEHVGIGTDRFMKQSFYNDFLRRRFERITVGFWGGYGQNEKHVEGFNSHSEWGNLTRGLVSRGYSDEQIGKILGGNLMRVYQQTWHFQEQKT